MTDDRCPVDSINDSDLFVAHRSYERASLAIGRGERPACPVWHAPLRRLLDAGAVLTKEQARKWADSACRFERADAEAAKRQNAYNIDMHRQETAEMRTRLAAASRLLNRRHKTVRMDDLRAALEGEMQQ